MYRHLEKLERYIGREIVRVRAPETFEYYLLEYELVRERSAEYRERFLRPLRERYDLIEYVGIAADEGYRLKRKNNQRASCRHPLVEWGMPMEKWDRCAFPVSEDDLEGRVCYGRLDLSSTTDITAFVLAFPPLDEEDKYSVLPYFWIPEGTVDLRVKRDHVPYDVWVRQGFKDMSPPTKELMKLTLEERIAHGGHPVRK